MADHPRESPAEQFDRYLREVERDSEPLPKRNPDPPDLGEIALRAFFIVGAVVLYGGLAYGIARLIGWAP